MKFEMNSKKKINKDKFQKDELDIAYQFAKKVYKEFGNFVKALVLFGSASTKKDSKKGDIDILIIVDDVTIQFTEPLIQTYRIIMQKTIGEISKKIHLTSMRLTSFWEYMRAGDPVAINILRSGHALIDSGFFDPMQHLLAQGRIRPTAESMHVYFARAPQTIHNSKWHLLQATMDLYWAVVDAAHASLMKVGQSPPSPDHVADMLEKHFVKTKIIEKRYASIMRNFHRVQKMITYREIREIKGQEYERYLKEADDFVQRMKKFLETNK